MKVKIPFRRYIIPSPEALGYIVVGTLLSGLTFGLGIVIVCLVKLAYAT